jgi:hypothetical protein
MHRRCEAPKATQYADYGGRGISVCERWADFWAFVADMGERPKGMTLDRRNNDGNYEPSNCKWSTRSEQGLNSRRTLLIEINGEKVLANALGKELGFTSRTIANRAKNGRPVEEILSAKHLKGYDFTPEERDKAWAHNRGKTHCPHGHEYSFENTYINSGRRHCRICMAERGRRWLEKKRALAHHQ